MYDREKGGEITCRAVSSPFRSILKEPQRAETRDITTNFRISVLVLNYVAEEGMRNEGKFTLLPQMHCSMVSPGKDGLMLLFLVLLMA